MNILIKRRQLVMATLVVVLAAAVFVNWYYTQSDSRIAGDTGLETQSGVQPGEAQLVGTDENEGELSDSSEYFAKIRLERASSHEQAMSNISTVMDSAEVSSQLAESAAAALDELTASIKLESDLETLVSAKLGCECVAVCAQDKVQIVVEKGKLNENSVLQIKDIVITNSVIPADGITILEAN